MVWQENHWHRTRRLLSADRRGLRAGSRECAWFSHRTLIAHKSRGHLLLITRHPAGSDPADRSPSAGNTPRLDSWLPRSLPSPGSFSPLPKWLRCRLLPVLSSSSLPACSMSLLSSLFFIEWAVKRKRLILFPRNCPPTSSHRDAVRFHGQCRGRCLNPGRFDLSHYRHDRSARKASPDGSGRCRSRNPAYSPSAYHAFARL